MTSRIKRIEISLRDNKIKEFYILCDGLSDELDPYVVKKIITLTIRYNRNTELFFLMQKYFDKAHTTHEYFACKAARYGNREVLNDMMLKSKVNYNLIAYNAAKGGHSDIVLAMISLGANSWHRIAYYAAKGGHKKILDDMIVRGATLIFTIAREAAGGGHLAMLKEILKLHPSIVEDWEYMDGLAGYTAYKGQLDVINYLSEVETKSSHAMNNFFLAVAASGRTDLIADVKIFGSILLYVDDAAECAASNGHYDMVKYLLENGATYYDTILEEALKNGHKDIADLVFEYKIKAVYRNYAIL